MQNEKRRWWCGKWSTNTIIDKHHSVFGHYNGCTWFWTAPQNEASARVTRLHLLPACRLFLSGDASVMRERVSGSYRKLCHSLKGASCSRIIEDDPELLFMDKLDHGEPLFAGLNFCCWVNCAGRMIASTDFFAYTSVVIWKRSRQSATVMLLLTMVEEPWQIIKRGKEGTDKQTSLYHQHSGYCMWPTKLFVSLIDFTHFSAHEFATICACFCYAGLGQLKALWPTADEQCFANSEPHELACAVRALCNSRA